MSPTLWFENGDESLKIRTIVARERMNDIFTCKIVARTSKIDLELDSFVGCGATAGAVTTHGKMLWAGVCARMEVVQIEQSKGGKSTYELTIVPRLWLLTQRRNHRIFQHLQTREIVTKILDEYGIEPKFRLTEKHPVHEYRVQHGETDFEFVNRLLEEAGITYYFERRDDECLLILGDTPTEMPPYAPIDFYDHPNEGSLESLFVTDVHVGHGVRPGKATIRDYDFRKPRLLLEEESKYELVAGEKLEEAYEQYYYLHGGSVIDGAEADDKLPLADGESVARHDEGQLNARVVRTAEANRFAKRHIQFKTNHPELYASRTFSIANHPREEIKDDKILLVLDSETTVTELDWWVRGTAVHAERPYRPELRTPKPRVLGPQTAIVVPPPDAKGKQKEIYTDELGRVHVHFHWDRNDETKYTSKATCWLRVSQSWAGTGWGHMMVPRVGQEVVVDFFDGDPDHPVITGRVYNNTTRVPRILPDHDTQTITRTASSPHKDKAFNEITFDDKVDKELVFIQAQRDMFRLTKRHDTDRTGNKRQIVVGEGRVAGIQRSDAWQAGEQLLVKMVKAGDMHIEDLEDPEIEQLKTFIDMSDGKIALTTGDATVVLHGASIIVDAKGALRFTTDGRLIMKASQVLLNTAKGGEAVTAEAVVADAVEKPTRILEPEKPLEPEPIEVLDPEDIAEPEVKVIHEEKKDKVELVATTCELLKATVRCDHGPDVGGAGRHVPQNGVLETWFPDTIHCKAEVKGACGDHPKWTFSPANIINKWSDAKQGSKSEIGKELDFVIGGWSHDSDDTGLKMLIFLFKLKNAGKKYQVTVTTCNGSKTFQLRGYPDNEVSFDLIPKKWKENLKKTESLLATIFAGKGKKEGMIGAGWDGKNDRKWTFKYLNGNAKIKAGFKEFPAGNSVFFMFVMEVGFKPLLSLGIRREIPLHPVITTLNEILSRLDIASLYIFGEIVASIDLTGKVGINAPGISVGGSIDGGAKVKFTLGVHLHVKEVITAELSASTEFSAAFGVEYITDKVRGYYGPVQHGACSGTLKIQLHSTWVQWCLDRIKNMRAMAKFAKYFKKDGKIEITHTFIQSSYIVGKSQWFHLLP